eukprot:4201613-Prymnesium_polylepis.1
MVPHDRGLASGTASGRDGGRRRRWRRRRWRRQRWRRRLCAGGDACAARACVAADVGVAVRARRH